MNPIASFSLKRVKLDVLIMPSLFNINNEINHPRFLINSANEYLVGAQLPYFPRGGLPRVNNVIGGWIRCLCKSKEVFTFYQLKVLFVTDISIRSWILAIHK